VTTITRELEAERAQIEIERAHSRAQGRTHEARSQQLEAQVAMLSRKVAEQEAALQHSDRERARERAASSAELSSIREDMETIEHELRLSQERVSVMKGMFLEYCDVHGDTHSKKALLATLSALRRNGVHAPPCASSCTCTSSSSREEAPGQHAPRQRSEIEADRQPRASANEDSVQAEVQSPPAAQHRPQHHQPAPELIRKQSTQRCQDLGLRAQKPNGRSKSAPPLPHGWTMHFHQAEGYYLPYFFHAGSQTSAWEAPSAVL